MNYSENMCEITCIIVRMFQFHNCYVPITIKQNYIDYILVQLIYISKAL